MIYKYKKNEQQLKCQFYSIQVEIRKVFYYYLILDLLNFILMEYPPARIMISN
jgi:hypothetical protein